MMKTKILILKVANTFICATLKVKILFRPDHERIWPYHQRLMVHVPNQVTTHYLHLSGRCHARQMFCVSYDADGDAATQQPEDREDPYLVPAAEEAEVSEVNGVGESGGSDNGYGERPVDMPSIKLTFPRDDPDAVREVTVGCVAITNDGRFKGSAGGYEVEWVNNQYFSADSEKGACNPGDKATIKFTFKPPEIEETYGLDVGQWARTFAKVHLSSGFAHEHASKGPIVVLLEGYISI